MFYQMLFLIFIQKILKINTNYNITEKNKIGISIFKIKMIPIMYQIIKY